MLFSKFNVNKGEWLDLIFTDRNKSYGAYELRKYSDQYLMKALLISFGAFGLLAIAPAIYYSYQKDISINIPTVPKAYDDDKIYQLQDIEVPRKTQPKIEQLSNLLVTSQPATVNVNQVKYTQQMNVVQDALGVDPPTIDQINRSVIGATDIEGAELADKNLMPGVANADKAMAGTTEAGSVYDVNFVERMPEFLGGMSAWSKFLNKNLLYPGVARETGIQGRVTVSFVVEKDGSLSNIKVLRGIGGGCDEEAIRVIKKSPFWKPGMQNGNAVRVSYVIPIVFTLQ